GLIGSIGRFDAPQMDAYSERLGRLDGGDHVLGTAKIWPCRSLISIMRPTTTLTTRARESLDDEDETVWWPTGPAASELR
ncbi:hypothetical protein AB0B89_29050, partial [Sphaerisporangium sp. NPDC049002]|uniref:hypothetical protein n=1 Tax=Sphaerisporangium sp. NPDC049002 TaxID=3155392 RepID=UPI0033DEA353